MTRWVAARHVSNEEFASTISPLPCEMAATVIAASRSPLHRDGSVGGNDAASRPMTIAELLLVMAEVNRHDALDKIAED